jgi:integrase
MLPDSSSQSGSTPPRIPKYCRQKCKSRSDRAYVRINGKTIMLGKYDSKCSRQKYAELITDLLGANAEASELKSPTDLTLTELMAAYLGHVDEYYGYKSAMWYHVRSFMKVLRRHFGDLLAKEFKAKRLKLLRKHFMDEDWTRPYINEHVARVKRMFLWATSDEMVPTDVYTSLRSVQPLRAGKCDCREPEPVELVEDDVVEATLPCLSPLVAAMVQVQRLCGCRPGELTRLRKGDIDRSGDVWVATLKEHKTAHRGKQRSIYFGPLSQTLLLAYLACGDEDRVFPIRRDSYATAIRRAAKKANVPHWFPNQLRHASGTTVRDEFGLEHAQLFLGHATADVTQVYAKANAEKAIEVARKIG